MATLNVNGKRVQVDDSFLSLPPEQQNATVEEIAASMPKTAPPPQDQSYSGSILPFSKDAEGNVGFDSNAGLVGTIKRALTLPGDVLTGKTPMYDDAGHISQEVIGRSADIAGMHTAASPGSRGALRITKPVEPPTAEALKMAGKRGFNAVRDSGVMYRSSAVDEFARTLQSKLEQDGVLAELAPKTHSIVGKLQSPPEGSVAGIQGLIAARKALGRAAKDFTNPTEQFAASKAMDDLDGFIMAADPKAVLSGPAGLAARVQEEATANYAASKRSERLTGAGDAAELRAAAANSGQNIDNQLRQRAAGIVLDPKKASGFSAEEIAAIREVAEGTPSRNSLRFVGNLLGGGGGLGGAMTGMGGAAGGAAVGGPLGAAAGAALPVIGMGAKALANRGTRKSLANADRLTRSRSPLAERAAQNPETRVISPQARKALLRALLLDRTMSGAERRQAMDELNSMDDEL